MNPKGSLPALRVQREGRDYVICESLQIAEYLNSYPGQNLYPSRHGRVASPGKAVVDIQISTNLEPLLFYLSKYVRTGDKRSFGTVKEILEEIEQVHLKSGFYASGILGYEDVTLADVVLYPIIESLIDNCDERVLEVKKLVLGNNIEKWYRKVEKMDWARRYNFYNLPSL